mmetsp:Transcript_27380/g.58585  ORF Transcript_27380/g.58585 Transcript_27380/m.58585 type:complete len:319 (+) Transcript_27380:1619-2575(+)
MGIGVKKTNLKELRQKGLLRKGGDTIDFFIAGVAQFFSLDPFTHENPPSAQFVVHLGYHNALDLLLDQHVPELLLVTSLVVEVEFGVKPDRPFVQKCNVVSSLLRSKPFNESLKDFRGTSQYVKVLRDGPQDTRPLHLDGNLGVIPVVECSKIHLRETRRRYGSLRDRCKELSERTSEFLFDLFNSNGRIERLNAVLEFRQLIECGSRQDIRSDAHHLSGLDEGRAKILEIHSRLSAETRDFLVNDFSVTNKERCKFRQKRNGFANEISPSFVQGTLLLAPVGLNDVLVVNEGQTLLVELLLSFVECDVGFGNVGSLQ